MQKAIIQIEQNYVLNIKVTPKASKTEFVDCTTGRINIRLQALPVDGQANKALIDFLSKQFKVAKTRIQLVKGQNGRLKTILIPNPNKVPQFILENIDA
jgi:uncharacterized protein (TIGR00251 family)